MIGSRETSGVFLGVYFVGDGLWGVGQLVGRVVLFIAWVVSARVETALVHLRGQRHESFGVQVLGFDAWDVPGVPWHLPRRIHHLFSVHELDITFANLKIRNQNKKNYRQSAWRQKAIPSCPPSAGRSGPCASCGTPSENCSAKYPQCSNSHSVTG
jgi:hypothetical protein